MLVFLCTLVVGEAEGVKAFGSVERRRLSSVVTSSCEHSGAASDTQGRQCPYGNPSVTCLLANRPFPTLAAAWEECNHVVECGEILAKNGYFYLRRSSDPPTIYGNGGYLNSCPKVCAPGAPISQGRGCPAGDPSVTCLLANRAFPTLAAAWDACTTVMECGEVFMMHGFFYLRRSTDPTTIYGNGSYLNSCEKSCAPPALPDAQGRGCPAGDPNLTCLLANRGFPTIAAAWDACRNIVECGELVTKYGYFYLRRSSDPTTIYSNGGYVNSCPKDPYAVSDPSPGGAPPLLPGGGALPVLPAGGSASMPPLPAGGSASAPTLPAGWPFMLETGPFLNPGPWQNPGLFSAGGSASTPTQPAGWGPFILETGPFFNPGPFSAGGSASTPTLPAGGSEPAGTPQAASPVEEDDSSAWSTLGPVFVTVNALILAACVVGIAVYLRKSANSDDEE